MKPSSQVSQLSGVGQALEKKLEKLGIFTIEDLLKHYPRRYDDFSKIIPIAQANPGNITIKGEIDQIVSRRTKRRGTTLTEAIISDDSGSIKAIWFNQPYLAKQLPKDTEVYVSGELSFKYQQYAMQNPAVERVSTLTKNTARIVPIYPETAGLSSKQLRKILLEAIKVDIPDPLPKEIRERYKLIDKNSALEQVHFPDSSKSLELAKHRLGFEEIYLLLLLSRMMKDELLEYDASKVSYSQELANSFIKQLPFKMTDDQRKAAWQIIKDMGQAKPMNRLLQGDVGSGKTAAAAMAATFVAGSKLQTALLAPTEILANQHYQTLNQIIPQDISVEILTSSTKAKDRQKILADLASGKVDILVGTHALLQPDVKFKHLGLVIVDEQHRFGVNQRQELRDKSKTMPHMLSMSATPIPRSLALTVYGDLDISSIRQMPPGRKEIKTQVVTNARKTYDEIYHHLQDGGQVYVVCPLIEESDTLGATSVSEEVIQLKRYWKDVSIAALHGRLSAKEKASVMDDFRGGKIQVLVATTVVEVGVDVANANVILIEGAERFGLSTLHQLRGRVGRGDAQAYCYLKTSNETQAKYRLELMERYSDGFMLAEKDLEMRGAGELYGKRQHGQLDLRMAKLTDIELIKEARAAAKETTDI
ncbi:MAG: ATP-dependent DNA helicase RecG, partial [Candidatus Saccharimonadales bacterium]